VLSSIAARILGVIVGGFVAMGMGTLFVWIDRLTNDPIMSKRINKGSDRFFAEEAEREREIALSKGRIELSDF